MAGMDENPDAFHVVVELRQSQRLHHRRNLAQRPVGLRLGEIDIHRELDFPVRRRGIDQDLGRLDLDPPRPRCLPGQRFRDGHQLPKLPTRDAAVHLGSQRRRELSCSFVDHPPQAEHPFQE